MTKSTANDDPSVASLFGQLLAGVGVSDTRFARLVNDRARQLRRVELGLARTTVGHWRRGMRPRDPMVAELAAAEVSALLGYPLSTADLGWRGKPFERDDLGLAVAEAPTETLRTVAGISGRDMRRRDLLYDGTAFVATAFADPVLASLTGVIDKIRDQADVPVPTGAMIRDMTETFRRLDARFGGGEIRPQVVTFLHDRAMAAVEFRPDADVFSALSELTQFAGWLAQDCDRHAIAQRYYIQALSLAEHANDPMLAGRALTDMSDQAARLGHRRHSLALARAAIDRSESHSTAKVQAMLHQHHAWALACNSDEPGCNKALARMETAISRADGDGDGPAWATHYNTADVAECQGNCFRLLGHKTMATERLIESCATQAPERARARSFAEAVLALTYLDGPRPDLDGALDAGGRALDLASQLTSTRVNEKIAELDASLRAFPQSVAVREWRARAATAVDLRAANAANRV
jgi:hypothetical protein